MRKTLLFLLLGFFIATSAFARNLDDPSILQFYSKLNISSVDYSGHGHATTDTEVVYTAISPHGHGAADFDGSNDKVALGDVYNGIKSVSFWCRPATITEQFMELASGVDVDVASGTIGTTGWTSPTVYVNGAVSSTLTAGAWQFVSVTSATAINANAANLGVETTNFGDTDLCEVRFYSIELTQDEILQLYRKGYPEYSEVDQSTYINKNLTEHTYTGTGTAGTGPETIDGDTTTQWYKTNTRSTDGTTTTILYSTHTFYNKTYLDEIYIKGAVSVTINAGAMVNQGTAIVKAQYYSGGSWTDITGSSVPVSISSGSSSDSIDTVLTGLGLADVEKVRVIAQSLVSQTGEGGYETATARIYEFNVVEAQQDILRGRINSPLELWILDGTKDLSANDHTLAYSGGVRVSGEMEFDGTDDKIDAGDIGNIQTVSLWINPDTTTQEIFLVDTGADVMVSGGTVTYATLTEVAT